NRIHVCVGFGSVTPDAERSHFHVVAGLSKSLVFSSDNPERLERTKELRFATEDMSNGLHCLVVLDQEIGPVLAATQVEAKCVVQRRVQNAQEVQQLPSGHRDRLKLRFVM